MRRYLALIIMSMVLTAMTNNVMAGTRENLALSSNGAAVLTSSFADCDKYYSNNLIDGKADTIWRSFNKDLPVWIDLRWSSPVPVDRVVLRETGESRISACTVESTDAAGRKRTVAHFTNLAHDPQGLIELKFPTATGTRLRVIIEANSGPYVECSAIESYGPEYLNMEKLRPYWKGSHIWYPEPTKLVLQIPHYLRKTFEVPAGVKVDSAFVQLFTNDTYEVIINGKHVVKGFKNLAPIATDAVHPGTNTLCIVATPSSTPRWLSYALICDLTVNMSKGTQPAGSLIIGSDDTWRMSKETPPASWTSADFDDSAWPAPFIIAPAGKAGWGRISYADRGQAEYVTLRSVELPSKPVHPGEKTVVRVHLRPVNKLSNDYVFTYELGELSVHPSNSDFTFVRGSVMPKVCTSKWPVDKDTVVELPIELPEYAPDGAVPIRLEGLALSGGASLRLAKRVLDGRPLASVGLLRVKRFDKTQKLPKNIVAKLDLTGPVKAFRINGKDVAPVLWTYQNLTPEKVHLAAQTGMHLYRIQVWPMNSNGTPDDEKPFVAAVEQQIDQLLRIDPQAKVLIYTDSNPSIAWMKQHPEERQVDAFGELEPVSFFSKKHEEVAIDYVRRAVRRFEHGPYAGAIIGYTLECCGAPDSGLGGAERNLLETDRSKLTIGDYSPMAMAAYREWLKEKYKGSVEALRASWKNPNVTFETAAPNRDVLTAAASEGCIFRDPAQSNEPFDYYEFMSGALFRFFNKLGLALREETVGNKLLGIFYGYDTQSLIAYNLPGIVLHSNNFDGSLSLTTNAFDYYSVVPSYVHRLAGQQLEFTQTTGSMDLHGKQYMAELDYRTVSSELTSYGRQRSLRESVEVMKLAMSTLTIGGHAGWFLDWDARGPRAGGGFTEPEIRSAIGRGYEIYQKSLVKPRKSATEIAVIISDKAYFYSDIYPTPQLYGNLVRRMVHNELPHIGAPYDTYRLQDLADPRVQNGYKLYIFVNTFALDDNDMKAIDSLKRDGKTLLWFFAPGYVKPGVGLGVDGVCKATGMNVSDMRLNTVMQYTITDTSHPVTSGVKSGKTMSMAAMCDPKIHPNAFGPVFTIEDPAARVLALDAFKKPALAVKDFGTWKSVYCTVPVMDAPLLHNIASYAGVHLYTDVGPVVLADHDMLMLHVGFNAPQSLHVNLPRDCKVTDLFAQKVLSGQATTLDLPTPSTTTYLLQMD